MTARDDSPSLLAGWWWRMRRLLGLPRGGRPNLPEARPVDPQALGRLGERFAARALTRSGLRIIARNHRVAGVEVDLIAESPDEDLLLVIEVKTGRGSVPPERRVDRDRRRRLSRAARCLAGNRAVGIEVVAVEIGPAGTVVRRIRLEPAEIEDGVLRGAPRVPQRPLK